MRDAVVIGAGIAGLSCALRLAEEGKTVTLVTKGIGGLQLSQGTLDILGYINHEGDGSPDTSRRTPINSPLEHIEAYISSRPHHPYHHFTTEEIAGAAQWFAATVGPEFLQGSPSKNVLLPTAVGALRPTAFYQPSMAAGTKIDKPIVVVGLRRLKDFPAALVAENLSKQTTTQGKPIQARAIWANVEIRENEMDTSGVNHARAFDDVDNLKRLATAIAPHLREGEIVALPAVLGLNNPDAWQILRDLLGRDIFEIPLQPPSVPGMRLNHVLTEKVKASCRYINGTAVIGHSSDNGRLTSITIASAGRPKTIEAKEFVLAAGGFESGALEMDSYGRLHDTVLGLPVARPEGDLLHGDFWGPDQPLFLSGFDVDDDMRVLDGAGKPVYENLHVAGGNIRGAMRWREKSGEGIALASAFKAAETIIENLAAEKKGA